VYCVYYIHIYFNHWTKSWGHRNRSYWGGGGGINPRLPLIIISNNKITGDFYIDAYINVFTLITIFMLVQKSWKYSKMFLIIFPCSNVSKIFFTVLFVCVWSSNFAKFRKVMEIWSFNTRSLISFSLSNSKF